MFLDYLRLRIDGIETKQVLELVAEKCGVLEDRQMGWRSYRKSAKLDCGAFVAWDQGQCPDQVMVDFTGSQLGEFCTVNKLIKNDAIITWIADFEVVVNNLGGTLKVRRLDIAKDDNGIFFDWDMLKEKIDAGEFSSPYRKVRHLGYEMGQNGRGELRTYYFGERAGEGSCVRIYDKAKEQREKGKPADEEWIRVEVELKGRYAHVAYERFKNEGCAWFGRYLLGQIDFKDKPSGRDQKVNRWSTCGWWLKFCETGQKERLGVPEREVSLPGTSKWLVNGVSGAMVEVETVCQLMFGISFVELMQNQGDDRLHSRSTNGRRRRERIMGAVDDLQDIETPQELLNYLLGSRQGG